MTKKDLPVQPLVMPVAAVAPVAFKALRMVGIESVREAKEFVWEKVIALQS